MTGRPPAWLTKPPRDNPGPGQVFLTTDRFPIFYLQITKCGCTFLRNLLYFLDHDVQHPDAARIHSHDDEFVKAALVPLWIMRKSPYVFTVIRNPVDRFLSLYFDKIANLSNPFDRGLRERVIENAGLVISEDTDLAGHQDNCLRTLHWLERNLSGETSGKANAHWRRQSARIKRAAGIDLRYLTLDGLSWQLPIILSPIIRDIADRMAAISSRNQSPKPYSRVEILTPEIEQSVQHIYRQDAELFERVSAEWGAAPMAAN